ncbi:MAG: response regulator [Candidatus Magnetominusculus sp. LBB02]|nr:response regulator [Candidatus Magnetominusculus sp. LBB02]
MYKKTVLIVEDEFIIANMIKMALKEMGFSTAAIVSTASQAVEHAKADKPDIILMDISLAGPIDGIEAARQIHDCCDIPLIFLTSHVDDALIERAKLTEPFGYLLKPFQEKDLQTHIEMALYRHETQTKLRELNRTLENRVKEELEVSRQKDLLLIQQSKMATMGEMLGAIAHQWRQPLNAVALYVQDARDAYESGELDAAYMADMVTSVLEQVNFMSNTINDFMNFFKPSKKRSPFNVNTAIKEVISLVYDLFKKADITITLTCAYPEAVPKPCNDQIDQICVCEPELEVNGYKNEFKQVILNILCNARDAIAPNKEKGIKSEGKVAVVLSRIVGKVKIEITDNGGGIPAELMGRLFQPYFTTKGADGTGIGLHMSKIIIENNMSGKLYAANGEKGSIFTIELDENV